MKSELATFGAGCFWGVEETFRNTKGVLNTAVGYEGGTVPDVSYEMVCIGNTNHAEVVQVEFDPAEVSYEKLLEVFWENHNPTTFNRQGPDVGTQYRSVIFYHSDEQKVVAEKSREELVSSGKWGDKKIVTQIVPAETFYKAEDYHQQYLSKRGLSSCHI